MNNSDPGTREVEPVGEIDDSNSGSNHIICDIDENKCSSENDVNLQAADVKESSMNEDANKIEHDTSNTLDYTSYNRKRVRERSRKLTKLLQEHEKMLRRTFNQGLKQISKCKDLSDFTDEKFILIVSNFPKFWSCTDIKHYIEAESGSQIDRIQVVENCGLHEVVKLTFHSFDEAKDVMDSLYNNEVEGIKLCIELKVVKAESDTHISDSKIKADSLQWRPDLDVWEIDPEGLYGLKPIFLKSLSIEPPIDKWVQVSNFRCEKSELREVLELAGHVLMCTVMNFTSRRAKVMYSHPLEAVQAISMLNGQTFYGMTLKLEMDISPNDTIILPKGLTAIGMGLGEQGKPLRNVVDHYKRHVKCASSSVNQLLFSDVDNTGKPIKKPDKERKPEMPKEKVSVFGSVSIKTKNVTELFDNEKDITDNSVETNVVNCTPVKVDKIFPNTAVIPSKNECLSAPNGHTMNVKVCPSISGSHIPSAKPLTSGLVGNGNLRPHADPNFGACISTGTCSPQSLQVVAFRPRVVQVELMTATSTTSIIRPGLICRTRPGTFSVQMSNLPLTTTFPLLYEKLSVCGQVLSLQFTTPGCAVASFGTQAQAERCIHQFNMLNVEGYVINAKLM